MKKVAAVLFLFCASLYLTAPPATADPLDQVPLPTCHVQATANDGYGVYLFFDRWYWGLGTSEISCTATVKAAAVTVYVQLTPQGSDANSAACQVEPSCYTEAEARGPDSPAGNCTNVLAKGLATEAAVLTPADRASSCSTSE